MFHNSTQNTDQAAKKSHLLLLKLQIEVSLLYFGIIKMYLVSLMVEPWVF